MDDNRYSDLALVVMKSLNLFIILYIALVMAHSLSGYIEEGSAYDFLGKIYRMPIAAWKIPAVACGLYFACLLLLQIQNTDSLGLLCKVGVELAISFCISYVLGFSYTGMVLLVLADVMRYFPRSKWRFLAATAICMFYLLMDYNLLSVYWRVASLEDYLGYFQYDARAILSAIKNILISLNMMVFLVYMIELVRTQYSEKERILSLNSELKRANICLEEYARESEKAAETRERNRLAMEIHDTLGHALIGIITGLEACITLMDAAPEATKEQLKVIADVARQGITDVRRSVKALRPDALEKMNLEEALLQMVDRIRAASSVEIIYDCTTELNGFKEDEEDIIYRIVQESITNSIRHGKAKRIQINIDREYNVIKVYIKDNGIGCSNVQKGFGLHHMEERLNLLHGSFEYSGEDGFVIEARIPVRWGNEKDNPV